MTILQSSIASNVISGATGATGPSGTNGTNGATGATGGTPWTISGANTYFSGGNVGINNSSPGVLTDTTQVAVKANVNGDSMFVAQNSNGLTTAKFGFQFTGGIDNPVIGSYTNHPLVFLTNNTERMRLDSSGNVGIGTSSPAYKFQISGVGTGVTSRMGITNTTTGSTLEVGSDGNGGFLATSGAYNTLFYNNGSEQMRITKDGDFLMAPAYRTEPRGKVDISAVGGTVSGLPSVCLAMSRWGDAGVMVNFFPNHGSTTSIGNIYNAGLTNTQYNTSSDYRLKENIAPMTGALAKIALLKPCTYTWKSTQADGQGFIAHELQEVFPDAVCGEKDAVDGEGNVVSQGVDTSYLVATLTAAIQEQQAMIEELKAEVAALKGNN